MRLKETIVMVPPSYFVNLEYLLNTVKSPVMEMVGVQEALVQPGIMEVVLDANP